MGLSAENSTVWQNYEILDSYSYQNFIYSNSKILTQKFLANSASSNGKTQINNFLYNLSQAKKLKTSDDIEKEKYKNSDRFQMINSLTRTLAAYLEQREFEKKEDFEKRTSYENLKNYFSKSGYEKFLQLTRYYDGGYIYTLTIGEYNPDTETFAVNFKTEFYNIIGKMQVPIDKAQKFRNDYKDMKYGIKRNPTDFVEFNNFFVPKKLFVYEYVNKNSAVKNDNNSYNQFIATFEYQNSKPISYSNIDLNIDTPFQFNLTQEIEKENIVKKEEQNKLTNIVGMWSMGNEIYHFKENGKFNIYTISKYLNEDEISQIGLFEAFDGDWTYNNDVIKYSGTGEKIENGRGTSSYGGKFNMYIINSNDKKIIYSKSEDKSSPIELLTFSNEDLRQLNQKIENENSKKLNNSKLKETGKSLLKSILK